MKKFSKIMLLCAILAIVLMSCNPIVFYQVYEVGSNNVNQIEDCYIYENDDIVVGYNFCSEGGDVTFFCKNKTDKKIYILLDKSFYINNDIAYDYFRDMDYTNSYSSSKGASISQTYGSSSTLSSSINFGNSSTFGNSSSLGASATIGASATNTGMANNGNYIKSLGTNASISALASKSIFSSASSFSSSSLSASISTSREKKISEFHSSTHTFGITNHMSKQIVIPPHSAKYINSFTIYDFAIIQCGQDMVSHNYPTEKSTLITFNEENSPIKFSNYITYSFNEDGSNEKDFTNSFFVASIQNFANNLIEQKIDAKQKINLDYSLYDKSVRSHNSNSKHSKSTNLEDLCNPTYTEYMFLITEPYKFYNRYTK